jgi:hypothetical protein
MLYRYRPSVCCAGLLCYWPAPLPCISLCLCPAASGCGPTTASRAAESNTCAMCRVKHASAIFITRTPCYPEAAGLSDAKTSPFVTCISHSCCCVCPLATALLCCRCCCLHLCYHPQLLHPQPLLLLLLTVQQLSPKGLALCTACASKTSAILPLQDSGWGVGAQQQRGRDVPSSAAGSLSNHMGHAGTQLLSQPRPASCLTVQQADAGGYRRQIGTDQQPASCVSKASSLSASRDKPACVQHTTATCCCCCPVPASAQAVHSCTRHTQD